MIMGGAPIETEAIYFICDKTSNTHKRSKHSEPTEKKEAQYVFGYA